MSSETNTPVNPRGKLSPDAVFFALTSRLPFTPTMTFCEEIADRANRNPCEHVWLHRAGQLAIIAAHAHLSERWGDNYKLLVDLNGLVPGPWDESMAAYCEAGSRTYGIPGLT